ILLMDEPFSALDPLIRTRLQDELLDLQARLKRTIIFVSHDLDEAFKLGGRIAIMEGGRIVQCGTPQEIIRAPANDYVADFVAHMNPLGVLCAQDVMVQGTAPENAPEVPHDMTVNEVIKISRTTEVPIRVLQDGKPVGIITSNDILDNLAK
ncbi:MAG TPA: choline ABC transporter ATP-binding protein, partial [Rhodospirillaceae bacterium]|nr:choline ABC transporter ATP-binding protein [Rhodospirillaceae bacterium]